MFEELVQQEGRKKGSTQLLEELFVQQGICWASWDNLGPSFAEYVERFQSSILSELAAQRPSSAGSAWAYTVVLHATRGALEEGEVKG